MNKTKHSDFLATATVALARGFLRIAAAAALTALCAAGCAWKRNLTEAAPTVAFEARLLDGDSGKLLGTAADRRGGRMKLVNVDLFTLTQVNREICDEWAEQFMQAFNREIFPKVKRRGPSLF